MNNAKLVKILCLVDTAVGMGCILKTSPSPRDRQKSSMPSYA